MCIYRRKCAEESAPKVDNSVGHMYSKDHAVCSQTWGQKGVNGLHCLFIEEIDTFYALFECTDEKGVRMKKEKKIL